MYSALIGDIDRGRDGRRTWRQLSMLASACIAAAAIFFSSGTAYAAGPAVCPAGQTAATVHLESFESPESSWQARLLPGSGALAGSSGQLGASHWHLPPPELGRLAWSGSLNIWADLLAGGALAADAAASVIEMPVGVRLPGSTRLTFVHRFDFTALPGSLGLVEYSLDNGSSWQSMGSFSRGIESLRSTHLDLAQWADSQFRLRFRVETPARAGRPKLAPEEFQGWAIDDVHFYTCSEQGPGRPSAPAPVVPVTVGADAGGARALSRPAISLAIARRPAQLRRGVISRLNVVVGNHSGRRLRAVRVCFRAPMRLVLGRRCTTIKQLPAGASAELAFPVRVRSAVAIKRARILIRFAAANGNGVMAAASRRYRLITG